MWFSSNNKEVDDGNNNSEQSVARAFNTISRSGNKETDGR